MNLHENICSTKEINSKRFTVNEHNEWMLNIQNIYKRMRFASENGFYVTFCHVPLIVYPNVYSPDFFTDSFWFSKNLLSCIKRDSSILEIGTGTGIISIMLAKNGAKRIIATDKVHAAVENARANVLKHGLSHIIKVNEGDIYNPIATFEKFDYIFWAHPFNNSPVLVTDPLLCTGLDYNYNCLRDYIKNAKYYLKQKGKLLIGTGDSADLETMKEIAYQNNYIMNLLKEETLPLEYGKPLPINYRIYEFIN